MPTFVSWLKSTMLIFASFEKFSLLKKKKRFNVDALLLYLLHMKCITYTVLCSHMNSSKYCPSKIISSIKRMFSHLVKIVTLLFHEFYCTVYLEFPDESTGNFPHLVEEVSSTPRPAFFPQIFRFSFGALPLLVRMLLLSSHVLDLVNTYDLSTIIRNMTSKTRL